MTGFTGNLKVEVFHNSDMPFGVVEMFEFHSGEKDSGLLCRCEEGFRFDGTSMPWVLRWLISPADPDLLQCAAVHDEIYRTGQLIMRINGIERRVPVPRQTADAFMAECMKARQVAGWKQTAINNGLAVGGGPSWRKHARRRNALRTETTR